MGRLEEYKESAGSTSKAIPEIVLLTLCCWILKGFEWYFLGYALGITQITLDSILPYSPVSYRFSVCADNSRWNRRARIRNHRHFWVIANALPGIPATAAQIAAFALLARGLLIFEDLAGVPQIVKSTSLIFSHKNPEAPMEPTPPTPI